MVEYDDPVRLRLANQRTVILSYPKVVGDSTVGEVRKPAHRTAVALSDVRHLDDRRFSAARTTGLVLGISAVAFVISALALAAADPGLGNAQ